jgi:signal transduction histidine kinase/ligand-binding sensor domain-containing protein
MFRCRFQRALLAWLALAGHMGLFMPAGASPADGAELPYRVTRWTAENGLPQGSIKALAQTRDGYLWVGTLRGLARFDGVRFKVFDHSNTPQMTHDSINDLAVDAKDGGLWIGTGDGLLYYRDHQFDRYGLEQGIPGPAGNLCASPEGGVWLPPQAGQVALARGGRVQAWEFGVNNVGNAVFQLGEQSPTELLALMALAEGRFVVYRLDLNTKSLTLLSFPSDAPGKGPGCFSFFQDADESLWLCTTDGIWRGSEKNWTQITTVDPATKCSPERIYQTRDGQVWVTQFEDRRISLQRLAHGRLEPFTAPDMPSDLVVTHLLEDREGDLWIGMATGLLRLEPKRIRVYSRRNGMRSDDTLAVAKGAYGTIWVGTTEGVSGVRSGQITNLPPPQANRSSERIPVFLLDHKNALWAGWVGPWLACFQEGEWKLLAAPAELGNTEYLKAIQEDRQGRMWWANGERLLCNDRGRWTIFSTNDGVSHPDVRVVHQDRRGDLWFGTFGGGLNRLKDGRFTNYKTGRGEMNNRAWWIHEDADGVFWVGSEDGLNRFVPPGVALPGQPYALAPPDAEKDGAPPGTPPSGGRTLKPPASDAEKGGARGRFFTFTTEQGLGENVVNNIQEDDFGCLWLSGLRGIYRISRQQLNEVAAGRRAAVECAAYGEADGMLNSECNGGDNQPAGCKDDEGRIWFPTVQGVVVIDPKEMRRTELPPPVVIEQVRANEQVVFGDGARDTREVRRSKVEGRSEEPDAGESRHSVLRLAPGGGRVLEIHYTASSLLAPERVRFKYRLEGHDRDWLWDDQNRRVAFYTDLRPGDYTFHVTACNSHGAWNEQGDRFSFQLAPHFYETWPFYFACGGFVVFAGLALHGRRVRILGRVQRVEQQRALQEERTRIAKDLHDDLGANLTGLALQLDLARSQGPPGQALDQRLGRLAQNTRGLVDNMREVVWAMNPQHDNVESLASFLGQYTENYLAAAGLRCRLELPSQATAHSLSSNARHQLFLVVKEALHNVVRHAQAGEVHLCLAQEHDHLQLTISDNGCGLPPAAARVAGHGLDNMQKRVTSLGGEFSASRGTDGGTRLTIILPLGRIQPLPPP